VQFTNDGYGGSKATDRNLYVDYLLQDGHRYEGEAATSNTALGGSQSADPHAGVMVINGTLTFTVDPGYWHH
jgi:hypothetical protein